MSQLVEKRVEGKEQGLSTDRNSCLELDDRKHSKPRRDQAGARAAAGGGGGEGWPAGPCQTHQASVLGGVRLLQHGKQADVLTGGATGCGACHLLPQRHLHRLRTERLHSCRKARPRKTGLNFPDPIQIRLAKVVVGARGGGACHLPLQRPPSPPLHSLVPHLPAALRHPSCSCNSEPGLA